MSDLDDLHLSMAFIHFLALLAVIQYLYFGAKVGQARNRYHVKAPAVTGDEHFERAYRVQMNTLEQLVVFLPALFIAGSHLPGVWVSLLGILYLVGRMVYARAYARDPASRAPGFLMTVSANILLILTGLLAIIF